MDRLGYTETLMIISQNHFQNQEKWKEYIWECIDLESFSEQVVDDYKSFLNNHLDHLEMIMPSINMIATYSKVDEKILDIIVQETLKKPELSSLLLSSIFSYDAVEVLIDVLKNKLNALTAIYMNAVTIRNYYDYKGSVFQKIFEKNPRIWIDYVGWLKKNYHINEMGESIIRIIWNSDTWADNISYAYEILFIIHMVF